MLRECNTHGYFRGEICPLCGDEGRFLLNDEEMDRITRIIAGCLRHFPQRYGLRLDSRGWVDVSHLVGGIQKKVPRLRFLRPYHIEAIVQTDEKGRYEINHGRIRATYGHTLNVILDHPTTDIPPKLYYPVPKSKLDDILSEGVKPVRRAKVHLSDTLESCISAGVSIKEDIEVLEVDAESMQKDGRTIMHAGKVVYLTDEVPPEYLKRVRKGIKRMVNAAREERERYIQARKRFERKGPQKGKRPRPRRGPSTTPPPLETDEDEEPKWEFV